jgi:hypothetical protein
VALSFVPSDACLLVLQAGVVAAPRPAPRHAKLDRLRGWGWSLIPIASIVSVVFTIRYVPDTASELTYLALIAVPPLAAAALGWAARGSRPIAALGVVPLFLIAWYARTSLAGEAAAALLTALSCVTLGVLLAAVTPPGWLKIGIVLMGCADTWLVVSNLLQTPNATLIAAHPAAGLPRLQSVIFGSASMGYGDLFVAGLLGAVLASDPRMQRRAALLTLATAAVFDLLFLVLSELPATVPVALTVIVMEVWSRPKPARRRVRPWRGGRPAASRSRSGYLRFASPRWRPRAAPTAQDPSLPT